MSEDLVVVAQSLSAHLQSEFGFTVEDKESSLLMKGVVTGLDIAHFFGAKVPDHKAFMERYATTIGKVVGLPKPIRDNPLSKMEVVAHEAQHVLQYLESKITFAWLYLKNPADRAQYEADAYATGIAVRCWLTGQEPSDTDLDFVLRSLVEGYHLRDEDITYARVPILSHFESIRSGIYMTRSARVAIAFLEANYPSVKGTVR